jgi:ABC-type proline/glycine betaine transport system ATPase subunit
MSAAIEFRNLCVAAPQGRVLLHDISLLLEESSATVILGRSGSGKSTLLRTVNRMVEARGGDVLVRGERVRDYDVIALRRSMGYVIQETGLFPHFNVERNVALALEIAGRPREERAARSRELLATVGLEPEEFARRLPHQLSGGQRQRVGLARALAGEPAILLMDEPFGALDAMTRDDLNVELTRIWQTSRRTVLFVTHSIAEAIFLSDRVVVMSPGPGRVREVVPIDLPRPRPLSVQATPEFATYVTHLRSAFEALGVARN